jgi:hypothetical protein
MSTDPPRVDRAGVSGHLEKDGHASPATVKEDLTNWSTVFLVLFLILESFRDVHDTIRVFGLLRLQEFLSARGCVSFMQLVFAFGLCFTIPHRLVAMKHHSTALLIALAVLGLVAPIRIVVEGSTTFALGGVFLAFVVLIVVTWDRVPVPVLLIVLAASDLAGLWILSGFLPEAACTS